MVKSDRAGSDPESSHDTCRAPPPSAVEPAFGVKNRTSAMASGIDQARSDRIDKSIVQRVAGGRFQALLSPSKR